MALDGAFLYAVKKELDFLKGGRIDKIYQPSREEIIISIRTRNGAYKLLMCANASSARVHITSNSIDNPKQPPMFCMLLRKHLTGGRLLDIRQDGLERILYFDFECMNEMGDIVTITIACEIMGKYSNIIIIGGDGRIIDSIKRVDEDISSQRLILPNVKYEYPPRDSRLNFLECTGEEIREAVLSAGNGSDFSKTLIKIFEGISPLLAREWIFYAGRGEEITASNITENQLDRLCFIISQTANDLKSGNNHCTIIKDRDGNLKEFSFMKINQYGNLMVTSEGGTVFEVLDSFYEKRDSDARLKQRANDLFKLLVNTSQRISKRLANQKDELAGCADKDSVKLNGDLISANIYRIQKGDTSVTLENFYDEECPQITIKLDPRLTPPQNAQKYYTEYRKAVTAEKMLAKQIQNGEQELLYIESVFDSLTRAKTENEITELRLELAQQGYIKANKLKGKPPKSQPPLEFVSSDGYTILVGRNNSQNDKLTTKIAEKTDIWLHTHNIPGSHVLILTEGTVPPDRTIEEAAILAAVHSKAADSVQVPVDYCMAKFVKKPNGAKPGMVIFTNNKTAFINPDSELAEKLSRK